MMFSQKTRISEEEVKLENRKMMLLLLPNVLWHKRMQKYVKSFKQEKYYNAELVCEK
jgi:hypothetical protein